MLPDRDREQPAAGGDQEGGGKAEGLLARYKQIWKEAREVAERENCAVRKMERRRGNLGGCSRHSSFYHRIFWGD